MAKNKKKKVMMPSGIRNKLMAAVAMLLVSSIMVVSSTYAWFTLSTAPEVTGITTSVGANGNLEIALLNTETYADLTKITSAVGDSSAVKDSTAANITWGNLVDLSDTSYGLTGINLLPADVNGTTTTTGDAENAVTKLTTVTPANLLKTPVYGADGRVKELTANTVSAVYDSTNSKFPYTAGSQSYGVRAIGVTSVMTPQQIAFGSAKASVIAAPTLAKRGTTSALAANMKVIATFAGASETPANYTEAEITAFKAIADGVVADIAVLENAYRSAVIAYSASTMADEAAFATAKTSAETAPLNTLASTATAWNPAIGSAITALAGAKTNALSAQSTLGQATVSTSGTEVKNAVKLLIGETPEKITEDVLKVYINGGAVGEIANQIGKFTLAETPFGNAYAGASSANETGYFNAPSTGVVAIVTGLSEPAGGTSANISDTYGYVIDFAFRTNASGADLQLQTTAANRVYTDQIDPNLATQGSGSTVTFTYTSGLTAAQAQTLLSNIKLVFFNPDNGTVYTTAGLTDITTNTTSATANVKVADQTGDAGKILTLPQNNATKVSVLVYLDGNNVQNKDVANAASSGSLKLNLQFSSSETLHPMENTALKTMTKTAAPESP